MTIVDFLSALDTAVSNFTVSTLERESLTLSKRRVGILSQNLVIAYYNILVDYFTDSGISGDINFFTEVEIREIIDKLNNIMKTYLYTDFS